MKASLRGHGVRSGTPPSAPGRERPGTRTAALSGRRGGAWTPGLMFLIVATVWQHASALRLSFFADDYLFLDQVRGRSFLEALTSPDPLRNFWRPLGRQAYFWLVGVFAESPVLAHALNLALFTTIVVLLFLLTRRHVNDRAAVFASGFLALHYAADVPVRWASGSQDLLAVAGSLGALYLLGRGGRLVSAACFVLALLAKETVLVTPLVAVALLRQPGEPWHRSFRRAWPLGAALGGWAIAWSIAMNGHHSGTIRFTPGAVPAAPLHLLQVVFGAEWGPAFAARAAGSLAMLPPVLLVGVAIWWIWRGEEPSPARTGSSGHHEITWPAGAAWALLGTIPVMAVAHIWSAYYYLFALCGIALLLGASLARRRVGIALAVFLGLAAGSQLARTGESFATADGNWNTESHLNRFYFDRSMWWVNRYLEDLRRQRPTLAEHTTLFFSGTRAMASWQAADGPLVRWAYRDPTLHSYYPNEFSLAKVERGPLLVFTARNDSLLEVTGETPAFLALASGLFLSEHFALASDAVALGIRRQPDAVALHYWRAWLQLAVGDSAGMTREFTNMGFAPRPGPSPQQRTAEIALAAGDTAAAVQALSLGIQQHALDPALHARLSEIELARVPGSSGGAMEALAARLLQPADPVAWRRWAQAQYQGNHLQEAYTSLRRSRSLAGPGQPGDRDDARLLELLRSGLPGGELARQWLRERPTERSRPPR